MTVPSAFGGVHKTETLIGEIASALTQDTGAGAEGSERKDEMRLTLKFEVYKKNTVFYYHHTAHVLDY